jgi:hypothetical protein
MGATRPEDESDEALTKVPFKARIQWENVAVNLFIHLGALVGFYYLITMKIKMQTFVYCETHLN